MKDQTPLVGDREAGVQVVIDVDDLHQALKLQVAMVAASIHDRRLDAGMPTPWGARSAISWSASRSSGFVNGTDVPAIAEVEPTDTQRW